MKVKYRAKIWSNGKFWVENNNNNNSKELFLTD